MTLDFHSLSFVRIPVSIEAYKENTYDPNEYFIKMETLRPKIGWQKQSALFRYKDMYTPFHGHCKAIEITEKVNIKTVCS